MGESARALYEALRALEHRAKTARKATGQVYSRRETERALRKDPYGIALDSRRISTWLPTDPAKAQVPRTDNCDAVWALVRLWSSWAGEGVADRRYWSNLIEAAQPERAVRTATRSAAGQLISDLTDPFTLEVHPAIDVGVVGLPLLPVYVERDHDVRLGEAVQQVTSGRSAIVVLIGGSSTGKTRACWEALHKLPRGWRLWHPISPDRPEAATEALDAIGPRTVVWLNETQHYLLTPDSGLGECVAAGLRELMRTPERGPVLILGTLWHEYWDILTTTPRPGTQLDPHAQARALLTGPNIGVAIPDTFTGTALEAVSDAATRDPRLAEAHAHAERGEITQYLAGAPAVVARYQAAPPPARALIEAAMDARRLGHSRVLSLSMLKAAAGGYLTDQQYDDLDDDQWLTIALAYVTAAASCRGARPPLSRVRPRPGDPHRDQPQYRLSDYLEQYGNRTRRNWSMPRFLWDALAAHAASHDLVQLAQAAMRRGLFRYAFLLYAAAAEAGDTVALGRAADLLRRVGRTSEADVWRQRAAEAGDAHSLNQTADLLRNKGQVKEAISCYQRAAEAGDPYAANHAVDLLCTSGRADEAITWLQARAGTGDTDAMRTAAVLMEKAGQAENALAWLRSAARDDDCYALYIAADLLHGMGRLEDAANYRVRAAAAGHPSALPEVAGAWLEVDVEDTIALAERADEAGNQGAIADVADVMATNGRLTEAITWLEVRGAVDDHALVIAAGLLYDVGQVEKSIAWHKRAAEMGHPWALRCAASLLQDGGRVEEAIGWLQVQVDAGNPDAPERVVELLQEEGRVDEAITWLQACPIISELDVLKHTARLLRREGRTEEAITCYRRIADAGDPDLLREAAEVLQSEGRIEEAIRCYLHVAEAGGLHAGQARWWAEDMLRKEGHDKDAEKLRKYGIEPGGRIAAPWGLEESDQFFRARTIS